MSITSHPTRGSIVTVDYSSGFKKPEMVKKRLAIVLSPNIAARPQLCTVVPLSLTPPDPEMPYHQLIEIPFPLPKKWGNAPRWIKGDMMGHVGFHRVDLLRLGKDCYGKRQYQTQPLPPAIFKLAQRCVLHGLGMSSLTKHL